MREYLVSEAMHALGLPTTRALAAVVTGEPVYREQVLPGAVLTRVAASHLRVGTFQHFAARGDEEALRQLTDYAIARHDPALAGTPDRALGLLKAVAERQAALIARWLSIGFIHGVMNTDNFSISAKRSISAPAPSSTPMIRKRSSPRSIAAADMLIRTSRRSVNGTSRGSPKRCCRCLMPTNRPPSMPPMP